MTPDDRTTVAMTAESLLARNVQACLDALHAQLAVIEPPLGAADVRRIELVIAAIAWNAARVALQASCTTTDADIRT